ncbi:MAG: hypothetical protein ACPG8W_15765 [Candidatus Promineifilaceae bacterium]
MSARSERRVAYVELDTPLDEIKIGQQPSFKITKGFGDLWRKYSDNSQLTVKRGDGREFFVHIAAFPTDRNGIGFLTIDSVVPSPEDIPAAGRTRRRKKRTPKTWFGRLRARFSSD